MSAHSTALAIHVTAGSIGLALGPVIMLLPKRHGTHTRLGEVYHWTFLLLFFSAVALAILNPAVWWLGLVGAGSYGFALMGYRAAKRRGPGWLIPHVAGQGGSYIAMTTALLVVNWQNVTGASGLGSAIPWLLPTLIGSPLIAWVTSQIVQGRRPRTWARGAPARQVVSGQPAR